MRAGAAAALLWGAAVVAGCRATPAVPSDDMAVDMAMTLGDDLSAADLATPDLAMCPVGPEVCGNGCDDDRNGYSDGDDPACTSQMLATFAVNPSHSAAPALWRLGLEPTPHVDVLDGHPVPSGGMATFNRAFAPATYLAFDSSGMIEVRALDGGVYDNANPGFATRDVCIFNGELIVVELAGNLHRFKSDAKTEILPEVTVKGYILSACASDGDALYVARRPVVATTSEIAVYGKGPNGPVDTGIVIPLPDALVSAGYDHIVDFAYIKKSGVFIGLFATYSGTPDNMLDGEVMAPFGRDGSVGPFIDGGIWHGVGEFLP